MHARGTKHACKRHKACMHACAQVIPSPVESSDPGVYGNPAWWSGGGSGALFFHALGTSCASTPSPAAATSTWGAWWPAPRSSATLVRRRLCDIWPWVHHEMLHQPVVHAAVCNALACLCRVPLVNTCMPHPGGSTIVSGATPTAANAVVWDLDALGNVYAYSAATLQLLWSAAGSNYGCTSNQNPTKFVTPILAGGRFCHG